MRGSINFSDKDLVEAVLAMRKLEDETRSVKEALHIQLDEFILKFLPSEIRHEYIRIREKAGSLWY